MATTSVSSRGRSVEVEDVDDEDYFSHNIRPSNASRLIESDNDDEVVSGVEALSSVINISEDEEEENGNNISEDASEAEETAETERGMIHGSIGK
jgi:hypothetical protein